MALIPAAQGIGQSAGPFLAGWLLQLPLSFPRMLLTVTVFAIACFATYAYIYSRLQRRRAAGAGAAPGREPDRLRCRQSRRHWWGRPKS